jgi:hypothetical protein
VLKIYLYKEHAQSTNIAGISTVTAIDKIKREKIKTIIMVQMLYIFRDKCKYLKQNYNFVFKIQ